jgi:hypothetical protein
MLTLSLPILWRTGCINVIIDPFVHIATRI